MSSIQANSASPSKNFIAYEYKTINTPRNLASVYADCYPYFGWEIEDSSYSSHLNRVSITLKRDRRIKNKPEINKLQRRFEESIEAISELESSKGTRASIVAFTVGIIGTAFMAGATFSFLAGYIVASIILAIPGFVGWALPYFIYKNLYKKRSVQAMTEVEREYDALYSTCEQAQILLV